MMWSWERTSVGEISHHPFNAVIFLSHKRPRKVCDWCLDLIPFLEGIQSDYFVSFIYIICKHVKYFV